MLTLLHLSDIHFRAPLCNTGFDPDAPYRAALLMDAALPGRTDGNVDVILVGGDIAFAGKQEEYEVALSWLYQLADVCGCARNRIFVVPGNHDVDRDIIRQNLATRNAQQAVLRAASAKARENEFLRQLKDEDTGSALLRPLEGYNAFAARFGCNVYTPDRFFWTSELLPIDNATGLRIYGLTSTMLSGAWAFEGGDDRRSELYLSPFQTAISPEYDVLKLAMCHHPPEWLSDGARVDDAFCERAQIHLLHHRHVQRVLPAQNFIRFAAGAVNPDRHEEGWQPGYNVIRLTVCGDCVQVEASILEWQANPDCFHPRTHRDGGVTLRHTLPIRRRPQREQFAAAIGEAIPRIPVAVADPNEHTTAAPVQETEMASATTKDLVFRFWNLSSSDRRKIGTALGVLVESDYGLPEPERYSRMIKRVAEQGLVERFAEEIHKREKS